MFQTLMYFVLEFLAVNRCAATAGAGGVAGLKHEIGNYAVEEDVIVVAAAGELGEVFTGLQGSVKRD